MTAADWSAVRLTAALAASTTLLLLIAGTPLAWWLARTRSRAKPLVASLVALPLVLPPSVLGFYLLLLMGPQGPLGFARLPFTFGGLVLASVLYSLPFVVQPLQQAFEAIPARLMEAAATLRAGPLDRFFSVVLMIGGNIPGQTRVLSVAVFEHVEALEFADAHRLAAGMVIFALGVLLALYLGNRHAARVLAGT